MKVSEPRIYDLLYYLDLLDAGCPLKEDTLTDDEWFAIGAIKNERQNIANEEAEDNR